MPTYRKKSYKKRYIKKRKSGWGPWFRKHTGSSLAAAAMYGVEKLKDLVNAEMFKFDSTFSGENITQATPLVQPLHGVANGDNDTSRTGNSIFVRNWNLKGLLYRSTAGDAVQMVRLSVILDTQQVSDTSPSYTDIYEVAQPWAHLNSNTVGRYKVLYSKVYTLDTVKSLSVPIEINLPMRHHIRYNGTSGTDIQKGGLYLCAVSTQATANYPILLGEYRLSYHDN